MNIASAEELMQRLQPLFVDVMDDKNLKINPEMSAKDVDEWDSITHISLLVAIEDEFGLRFGVAETKSLKNIGEMVTLIQTKMAKK